MVVKKYLYCFIVLIIISVSCSKENSSEPTPPSPNPIVKIKTPTDNSVILDTLVINVEASDDKGIAKVEIYIDNQTSQDKTLLTPPFTYKWINPQSSDSSKHSLFARAYDTDNNVTSTPIIYFTTYRFSPPSNLTFEEISKNSVRILWKDNSIGENGFKIEKKIDNGVFQEIGVTASNINNFTDNSADVSKTNYYQVRAFASNKLTTFSPTIKLMYLLNVKLFKTASFTHNYGNNMIIDINPVNYDIVGTISGVTTAIDLADSSGKYLKQISMGFNIEGGRVQYTPDGKYFFMSSSDQAKIVNVQNANDVRTISLNGSVRSFDISADGGLFATSESKYSNGAYVYWLSIRNFSTGEKLIGLNISPSTVTNMKFSQNGKYLIAGFESNNSYSIKVMEVASGNIIYVIPVSTEPIDVSFANNDEIIIASVSGMLKVWNASDGVFKYEKFIGSLGKIENWISKKLIVGFASGGYAIHLFDYVGNEIGFYSYSSSASVYDIGVFESTDKFVISTKELAFFDISKWTWQKK